jgi:excisionase family DNA binding protein
MTLNEVAALIRVHRVTVRKMVLRGELPAFRVGVFWRIRREDVDRLLARGDRKDPGK